MSKVALMARSGGAACVAAIVLRLSVLVPGGGCGVPFDDDTLLSGSNEVPPVTSSSYGFGSYGLDADQTTLTFIIDASRLSGPVTTAHFHNAPPGENGDIVFDLTEFVTEVGTEITITGTTRLDDWSIENALEEIAAGRIYVNIHTDLHPDGEIRAQIVVG